jgi:hypothetical protein
MTIPRFHFDLLLSCVIMSVVVFIKLCARMPAMGFLRQPQRHLRFLERLTLPVAKVCNL